MSDRFANYPACPQALSASIAEIDAWMDAGIPLCDVENETSFGESIGLIVHELKRLQSASASSPAEALPAGVEALWKRAWSGVNPDGTAIHPTVRQEMRDALASLSPAPAQAGSVRKEK